MFEDTPYLYLAGAGICILLTNLWLDYTTPNLKSIPAVGPSGHLTSFLGVYRYLKNGQAVIQEGVEKYKSAIFRIPMVDKWAVIVSDSKSIDDIRQARDEDLSFYDATNDGLQIEYILGRDVADNHYHIEVVRSALTRSLVARFGDIRDEIVAAFNDNIPSKPGEWVSVSALETVMQVVCRTSNRLFVSLPLCRDPDYCDLNITFTMDVFIRGTLLSSMPAFIRPLIGPLMSPMPSTFKRTEKHLQPLLVQRIEEDETLGKDRPDRPNDLISWLIDAAPENERNPSSYIKRILAVNYAAIHTSSNSFTQALFQLAAHPEYLLPLREEVEVIISEERWTKAAMGKMLKIDSFIRESIRYEGVVALVMTRRVAKPAGFTFSDGTHLPQGTFLACAAWSVHHEANIYPNPMEFDGFRFSNMREDEAATKHQIVNTTTEHLAFGHGRHACPGRFFAANELKAMLAHVVLNYDVRLEGDLPGNRWFGYAAVPNKDARVMFRKRKV
ncbi:cytochrome P450 [Pleurotus eryngii]|uniref:Cytochrome P450 n=1 Tax=Pleurotus eryngii TaxID=5323 RepID=A0A9P6CZX8_PLEER|nr:cytochrome P450 [Pleurotus eryngii]KAF9486951.1 cytochrome P450 [Pleurotus eryngii]